MTATAPTTAPTKERAPERAPGTGPGDDGGGAVRPPWTARRVALVAVGLVYVALTVVSIVELGLSPGLLITNFQDIVALLDRMLPPAWGNLARWVDLALVTFFIAVAGTAVAILLSVPLALMAARNTTPNGAAYAVARGVIVVARAIPDLVFALFFVRAVGLGVLSGILAIGLHAVGMLGKLFADSIEQIDEGPRQAALASGASRWQVLTTAVLPQVIPSFIAVSLYRLDINVRTSTVLGFVGVAGIGLELQSSFGTLRYQDAMGITAVILVLIVAVELFSAQMRKALIATEEGAASTPLGRGAQALLRRTGRVLQRTEGRYLRPDDAAPVVRPGSVAYDPVTVRPPWTADRVRRFGFSLVIVAMVAFSFVYTSVNPIELVTRVPQIASTLTNFFPPALPSGLDVVLADLIETIQIAFAATLLGVALAAPLPFLAARNVAPNRFVYGVARYFLVIERGLPELVLALIFVAAVGLGPFAGVLALTAYTFGFFAKLMSDAVEEVQPGPREAVAAAGATRWQERFAAVVPQVVPAAVGNVLYALDVNIRNAILLGIVGAGGIGFLILESIRTLSFEQVTAILLMMYAVVYAIERLSGWVRKQIL